MEVLNSPGACNLLMRLVNDFDPGVAHKFMELLEANDFYAFVQVGEDDHVTAEDRNDNQHNAFEAGMRLALLASRKRCKVFYFNHVDERTGEEYCVYCVHKDEDALLEYLRKIEKKYRS